MRITYTKHAEDKLQEKEVKKFGINKRKIEAIIKSPKNVQELPLVIRVVGKLDATHSLCVVYKFTEEEVIKVITFFPAMKGRYES